MTKSEMKVWLDDLASSIRYGGRGKLNDVIVTTIDDGVVIRYYYGEKPEIFLTVKEKKKVSATGKKTISRDR